MSYQLPLMQEEYTGIMVSSLECIRAPHHVISSNIHNFLLLIAVQVQEISAVIAAQCRTICLEIQPTSSQLKSVFLYV